MAEPQNLRHLDDLRFSTGMLIEPRFAFRSDLEKAWERFYARKSDRTHLEESEDIQFGAEAFQEEEVSDEGLEFLTPSSREARSEAQKELLAGKQKTPAVRQVSDILKAAADRRASDIHIEPQANGARVRVRVDGILRDLWVIPHRQQPAVISRIKILADMDIAERRLPQDGRILVKYKEGRLDLRISTLPTAYGEKVVIRLLEPNAPMVSFRDLGLSEVIHKELHRLIALPQGMLLVVGPTGSGKSTTLYAALTQLRSPTRNIVTVEDPVEYMLEGVNQAQVHTKAGLTFATCLRSILRQDPDVIMVGEVRDQETAEIALKAAQTGHFVLSTLHTNDGISAVTRLLDLGVPSFLVASSVSGILAQRLVRRLCKCKRVSPATMEYEARMEDAGFDTRGTMFVPGGCDSCEGTGYKGREAISELLVFNDAIQSLVRQESRPEEIRAMARGLGFRRMQDEALQKVSEGVTSFEEVMRVVPIARASGIKCQSCGAELLLTFRCCPYCLEKREKAESNRIGTVEAIKA